MQLVWLLDLLSSHPEVVTKLKLRLVDFELLLAEPEQLAKMKVRAVDVTGVSLRRPAWPGKRTDPPQQKRVSAFCHGI
jgi:hypothetical protein